MIALIPARAGSTRVPGKNLKPLAGHPLIAYSIAIAKQAPFIERVLVSTEDPKTAEVAQRYGAEVVPRSAKAALPSSPDIEWLHAVVAAVNSAHYAILRPTSPFRTVAMLTEAYGRFLEADCDSLRAVELVEQHPGKMWHLLSSRRMVPLHPSWRGWSRPTQMLPSVYVQNASLEMLHRKTVMKLGTLSGEVVCPYVCPPPEGYDINAPKDFVYAEFMVGSGAWTLPTLEES